MQPRDLEYLHWRSRAELIRQGAFRLFHHLGKAHFGEPTRRVQPWVGRRHAVPWERDFPAGQDVDVDAEEDSKARAKRDCSSMLYHRVTRRTVTVRPHA